MDEDQAVRDLLRAECTRLTIRGFCAVHQIAFSYCTKALYGDGRPGPKIKAALGLPAARNAGSGSGRRLHYVRRERKGV